VGVEENPVAQVGAADAEVDDGVGVMAEGGAEVLEPLDGLRAVEVAGGDIGQLAEKDFFGGAVLGEMAAHFAAGPHVLDGGVGGGNAAGDAGNVRVGYFARAVEVGVVEREARGELEHVRRLLRIGRRVTRRGVS